MKQRSFQMIKTNGVTLRTVVEGRGPLVILLHGSRNAGTCGVIRSILSLLQASRSPSPISAVTAAATNPNLSKPTISSN